MVMVGVAEAAAILGWDKRKVSDYLKRGTFPEPYQKLACGPIWLESTILEYKRDRENMARWRRKKSPNEAQNSPKTGRK